MKRDSLTRELTSRRVEVPSALLQQALGKGRCCTADTKLWPMFRRPYGKNLSFMTRSQNQPFSSRQQLFTERKGRLSHRAVSVHPARNNLIGQFSGGLVFECDDGERREIQLDGMGFPLP